MRKLVLFFLLALGLSACAGEKVWAPDDVVARAHYATGTQPSLTLYTVVNLRSGNGGHTSLLVNAPSERVLFDPAGSFHHPRLPERNDVVFGMTDAAVAFYQDYHARVSWQVVKQEIAVSPEVAELALRLVEENGAVPHAFCADSVSRILRQLPGFEKVRATMFPVPLMESFAKYPGVVTSTYHDDDPDNNAEILAVGI